MLDRMVLVDDRRRGAVPLSVAHPPAVFPRARQWRGSDLSRMRARTGVQIVSRRRQPLFAVGTRTTGGVS
jgi:hypothetical protein